MEREELITKLEALADEIYTEHKDAGLILTHLIGAIKANSEDFMLEAIHTGLERLVTGGYLGIIASMRLLTVALHKKQETNGDQQGNS
jgi:hypothetical protein